MIQARHIEIYGIVQGVGFRPFVFRLAHQLGLKGWVLNAGRGVEIHVEGEEAVLASFIQALPTQAPPAATIAEVRVEPVRVEEYIYFEIRKSHQGDRPITRISPDLAVCDECRGELFDPSNRRYHYPYINCTHCGPRYSVILGLPYDRPNTTVKDWVLCPDCQHEYLDPLNRRYHAQPTACPLCGPGYYLVESPDASTRSQIENQEGEQRQSKIPVGTQGFVSMVWGQQAIEQTATLLRQGKILAIKGLGGYHLACDAANLQAVQTLRKRKFRKEKPFALMAPDLETVSTLVQLTPETEALLTSTIRPIVLAPARYELPGVAPNNLDLGVMLPYTPLHHLLFAENAPKILVFTSANHSSEPIAYRDQEALEQLSGIADAFLIGERPIARRLDDSVVQSTPFGPGIVRRSRGYAPGAVAVLPGKEAILAVGADLKNTLTLVVEGQAFMSQFVGDLEHYQAFQAHQETLRDLLRMYEVDPEQLIIAHDLHPEYHSTQQALSLPAKKHLAIQHHRAHIASVLAERGAFERQVLGIALDGTGYGDDGTIWGGEFFLGSLAEGFTRVGHLRPAMLPGGDTAARFPLQAAAGFLGLLPDIPDLTAAPFGFPQRYTKSLRLVQSGVRVFPTTSAGRLFDTVAALLGFHWEVTFEGQAAIWLEHLARPAHPVEPYPLPWNKQDGQLDYEPLLRAILADRGAGREAREVARAFHGGLAQGLYSATQALSEANSLNTVVLCGGVFQNILLLSELLPLFQRAHLEVWSNRSVPTNDGGISLGQAAIAAQSARFM